MFGFCQTDFTSKLILKAQDIIHIKILNYFRYLYTNLDPEEINFRILTGRVDDVVRGTVCDPKFDGEPEIEDRSQCNAEL